MTHLLSIIVLLLKITGTKSCRGEILLAALHTPSRETARQSAAQLHRQHAPPTRVAGAQLLWGCHRVPAGVSLRTQELYALVFITRYLDLLTNFVSV